MNITLLTGGSQGDTQPFIALGVALQRAGHQATLATHENFAELARSYGLGFSPVKGDVSKVATGEGASLARRADNPLKMALSFRQLKTFVYDMQPDFYRACLGADAIVYHPGPSIGFFAAQQLGIPSILATPFPMTPTRAYPALMFYNSPRLGPAFNRLSHRLFEQVMWSTTKDAVRRYWQVEFGRPPQDFGNPFPRQVTPQFPTLVACSPAVFPRPQDWPEGVSQTGYWFLEEAPGWQPPAALQTFLESGAPPVYVGFGSIGDAAKAVQTTRLVIAALQQSGLRGVLATGWNGLAQLNDLPEDIIILESAPHAWLFPRMAAVVHHGGAGTTAAGLRAGVPSVILPNGLDQFAWGRRVSELGAGPSPIPRKQLTTERLAAALQAAQRPEIVASAASLGERIRAENGAESAAQIVLACLEP
jgi:sterol 3beta-glucosyltransferase